MAGPRIVISLEAERDLDALFHYIAGDSGLDRDEAILRRIEETISILSYSPRIGRVRPDLDGSPRTFSVWPWIIVYEPAQQGDGVVIWRVIDGRRDLPSHVKLT